MADSVSTETKNARGKAISSGKIKAALGKHIYDRYLKLIQNSDWLDWIKRGSESIQYYFNEQLSKEQIDILDARGQAIVTVNEIRPVIRHAISVLSAKSPSFEIIGVTEDDPKRAWVLRECVRYVLRQSIFPCEMERFTWNTVLCGRGAMLIHFDPDLDDGMGDIRISHIPREDLLIDPDAKRRDCQDARDMLIKRVLDADDAKNSFPKYRVQIDKAINQHLSDIDTGGGLYGDRAQGDSALAIPQGTNYSDNMETNRVVCFEYFRRIPLTVYWVIENDTKKTVEFYTAEEALEYKRALEEVYKVKNPQAEPETIKPCRLVSRKTKRIEHAISILNVIVVYDILPVYEYPIIIAIDEDTYNPFPAGEVDFLKGLQEFSNKALSIVIANAQVASNSKIYLETDALPSDVSIEEWQTNNANPGSVNMLAPGALRDGKFQVGAAQPLNQAFMTLVQFMIEKIQSSMGMYGTAMGDPTNAPDTARATMQLREWAMEKITPLLRSLDNSMTLLGRITVKYIQTYWGTEKAIRVSLDKNDPEFQAMQQAGMINANGVMPINRVQQQMPGQPRQMPPGQPQQMPGQPQQMPPGQPQQMPPGQPRQEDKIRNERTVISTINDISIGRYDIEAIPRSYMPTDTMARMNMLMDLKEKGIVDGEAVLDVLTIEDKYKIKERVSIVRQQAQQINVVTETVQKQQLQLEGMEKQLRDKDRQLAVMTFKVKEEKRLAGLYVTGQTEGSKLRAARKQMEQTSMKFGDLQETTRRELIKKANDDVKEAKNLASQRSIAINRADNSGERQTPQEEILNG